MECFKRLQLMKQTVVLGIRDDRIIEHMVAMCVLMQGAPELFNIGGERLPGSKQILGNHDLTDQVQENRRRAKAEPADKSCSSSVSYKCSSSAPIASIAAGSSGRPLSSVTTPSILSASDKAAARIRL